MHPSTLYCFGISGVQEHIGQNPHGCMDGVFCDQRAVFSEIGAPSSLHAHVTLIDAITFIILPILNRACVE
jgi:hypothetical protein